MLTSVPAAVLDKILTLLYLSRDQLSGPGGVMAPARALVGGRRAARLVHRYFKNRRALSGAHGGAA